MRKARASVQRTATRAKVNVPQHSSRSRARAVGTERPAQPYKRGPAAAARSTRLPQHIQRSIGRAVGTERPPRRAAVCQLRLAVVAVLVVL